MSKLTMDNKLGDVLKFLNSFMEDNGYPPSVREIAKELGIKSTATVYYYLNKLEEMGYIRKGKSKNRALELLSRSSSKNRDVPLIGRVQAGIPILALENLEETYRLPADFFHGNDLFMLTVSGDSMIEAGILNGDRVVIRKQPTALNGQIVVAMIDNEVTIKRFYKKNNFIVLHPENESMADIIVPTCEILGVLAGLIRTY